MKARKAPVILNLNDLEGATDDQRHLGIAAVRARIARRPGRWRTKMGNRTHAPTVPQEAPEWPEAA